LFGSGDGGKSSPQSFDKSVIHFFGGEPFGRIGNVSCLAGFGSIRPSVVTGLGDEPLESLPLLS
jgi:hypothetical protein